MHKTNKHYLKFKQELPSIILISILQAWWHFNFPYFIRLGQPWNFIASLTVTILCIIACTYMFSHADQYAKTFRLDYLDEAPEPLRSNLKLFSKIAATIIPLTMFWYSWHIDYYGMSNLHYAGMYSCTFLIFILFYKAMYAEDNL